MGWFRLHHECVNDPKVLRLPEAVRWQWVATLCIASMNGGALPDVADMAIVLRMTDVRVAALIATLVQAKLLERRGDGRYEPHNWNGRQYKTDGTDSTNAERQKRYRERHRNGVTSVTEAVTEKRPETDTYQIDVADDASARGGTIGIEAFDLTEKLLVVAGHDPKFWPPGWCGAPQRVKTWLEQGWQPETIVAAVTAAAARKHGAAAASVQFFERSIAEEHARQAAPLPKVEIREAQTIAVTNNAKPKSGIIQAADDLCRKIASFDGPDDGGGVLRGGAGTPAPRLLSHR